MVPSPDQNELAPARFGLVVASRAAGIAGPIDGITLETSKNSEIVSATRRGIRFGFTGKLCIHPDQIASVHAAFAPSADDAAWARRVVEAAEASNGAAVKVDGRMVDRAVILVAERVLALASQSGNRHEHRAPSSALAGQRQETRMNPFKTVVAFAAFRLQRCSPSHRPSRRPPRHRS